MSHNYKAILQEFESMHSQNYDENRGYNSDENRVYSQS